MQIYSDEKQVNSSNFPDRGNANSKITESRSKQTTTSFASDSNAELQKSQGGAVMEGNF
tara:strand:+ start:605 stop:781 length:177 start_codon:yes stop_codon:yes gene_type:complete